MSRCHALYMDVCATCHGPGLWGWTSVCPLFYSFQLALPACIIVCCLVPYTSTIQSILPTRTLGLGRAIDQCSLYSVLSILLDSIFSIHSSPKRPEFHFSSSREEYQNPISHTSFGYQLSNQSVSAQMHYAKVCSALTCRRLLQTSSAKWATSVSRQQCSRGS